MSKVLFIYERDMATVSIMRSCFEGLSSEWRIEAIFRRITDLKPEEIDQNDVVVFIRPNNTLSPQVAKRARQAGCFIVTFCDDDLLNLPKTVAAIPWRTKGLEHTLKHSDAILSSSEYIKKKYCPFTAGKRVAQLDTIVTPGEIAQARGLLGQEKKTEQVRLVYAAAPTHAQLFDRYIRPVMPALVGKYGKQISFTFVSVQPKLREFEDKTNITYVAGMPLAEYRCYMAEQSFDIGLAPLNDDEFSKCKYFNKFLEYSLQGVIGVYSNKEPYTYIVKNRENGFLSNNDPESWLEALVTAIDDVSSRRQCLKNAIDLLEDNFSQEKIMRRLCEELPELQGHRKPELPCKGWGGRKLLYYLSRPFNWGYLSWFQLRNNGIRGFVNKVKVHFREGKAYNRK